MIIDEKDVWFVIQKKRPAGVKATPVHRNGWLVMLAFALATFAVTAFAVYLVLKTGQLAMLGIDLLALPFLIIGLITTIKGRSLPLEDYIALKAKKS